MPAAIAAIAAFFLADCAQGKPYKNQDNREQDKISQTHGITSDEKDSDTVEYKSRDPCDTSLEQQYHKGIPCTAHLPSHRVYGGNTGGIEQRKDQKGTG